MLVVTNPQMEGLEGLQRCLLGLAVDIEDYNGY